MRQELTFLCVLAAILIILVATCSGHAHGDVVLIELHGPDGQKVFVNEHEISSLRQPTSTDLHRYFPKPTQCIVVTTNGKFIAVVEMCSKIRDMMR